jgi:hypothetical protein
MRINLTQEIIDNAVAKEKPYNILGEDGLVVTIYPNGEKKIRKKFNFDGSRCMITFYFFKIIDLKEAKLRSRQVDYFLSHHINPSSEVGIWSMINKLIPPMPQD